MDICLVNRLFSFIHVYIAKTMETREFQFYQTNTIALANDLIERIRTLLPINYKWFRLFHCEWVVAGNR